MGHTRKIIAVCDEDGYVFNLFIVPGNHNEPPYAAQLTEGIEAKYFIGDKAYDSDALLDVIASKASNQWRHPEATA